MQNITERFGHYDVPIHFGTFQKKHKNTFEKEDMQLEKCFHEI
jgi:hypothetical protein